MKIDFHILDNANQEHALLYACQLIELAALEQQPIYIHAGSQSEAGMLDDLLWSFRDDSFLPHALFDPKDTDAPNILIGYATPPAAPKNLLVNLTPQVPTFYKEFNQVIEIVFSDPAVQQLARERYKKYRENGEEINTIKTSVKPP